MQLPHTSIQSVGYFVFPPDRPMTMSGCFAHQRILDEICTTQTGVICGHRSGHRGKTILSTLLLTNPRYCMMQVLSGFHVLKDQLQTLLEMSFAF